MQAETKAKEALIAATGDDKDDDAVDLLPVPPELQQDGLEDQAEKDELEAQLKGQGKMESAGAEGGTIEGKGDEETESDGMLLVVLSCSFLSVIRATWVQ